MADQNAVDVRRLPEFRNLKLGSVQASLRARPALERRNVVGREALVRRMCNEFEEMPGLSLTLVQATRLFGITPEACSRILQRLVDAGFLRLRSDGQYALPIERLLGDERNRGVPDIRHSPADSRCPSISSSHDS